MTTKAHLRWTDGFQFVARPEGGPALILDNPESGTGASPMECLLVGVAGCTAMDVISIMQKKRQAVFDFQVFITGHRAADHPKRYTAVNIEFVFKGKDLDPKAAERAIELSMTKYCSAVFSINAELTHTYRIEDAQ